MWEKASLFPSLLLLPPEAKVMGDLHPTRMTFDQSLIYFDLPVCP
jgi:hypothetical protein